MSAKRYAAAATVSGVLMTHKGVEKESLTKPQALCESFFAFSLAEAVPAPLGAVEGEAPFWSLLGVFEWADGVLFSPPEEDRQSCRRRTVRMRGT